jgi:hypothetical protein
MSRWLQGAFSAMHRTYDRKHHRFHQSDTLTGLGFALLVGLSAVFYSAGHQADQPSILRSDDPQVRNQ